MNKLKSSIAALALLALTAGCGSAYSPLNPVPEPTPAIPGLIDDWFDYNMVSALGTPQLTEMDPPFCLDQCTTVNTAVASPGSDLPGGSSGACLRFFGTVDRQIAPWPYAVFTIGIPSGFDIDAKAPMQKLHFSVRGGPDSAGRPHLIRWVWTPATDYCWYEYSFTPTSTWTEYDLSLPGGAPPAFAKCSWGNPIPWSSAKAVLTQLAFLPSGTNTGAIGYDLYIDDIYLY